MSEMDSLVESGLVVESRFTTRKRIIRDLQDNALISDVIEAKSVSDGLRYLKSSNIDACFLGPTLKERVAIDFVHEGLASAKNRNCAFVAVVNSVERSPEYQRNPGDSAAYLDALLRAGAHGTLRMPYVQRTLTQVVNRAVKRAQENKEVRTQQLQSDLRALDYSQNQLAKLSGGLDAPVSQRFQKLSADLKRVAGDIESGRLVLRGDGEPSLATLDSIRLAFEQLLTTSPEARKPGSFDHYFIESLVLWFADKVRLPHSQATEILRLRLLSFPEASSSDTQ